MTKKFNFRNNLPHPQSYDPPRFKRDASNGVDCF